MLNKIKNIVIKIKYIVREAAIRLVACVMVLIIPVGVGGMIFHYDEKVRTATASYKAHATEEDKAFVRDCMISYKVDSTSKLFGECLIRLREYKGQDNFKPTPIW